MLLAALGAGFALSLGLIIAIGPQNVYVLRKGLVGRHVFTVTSICFLSDALLIVIAGFGIGTVFTSSPLLSSIAAWGGALFLTGFGIYSFRTALNPQVITEDDIAEAGSGARGKGAGAAAVVALGLTFLNPHVYLDTLVVIGSIAAQYEAAARSLFTAGAVLASAMWFYGIGYGARLLAPWFRRPTPWRVLDTVTGLIMIAVAAMLVLGEVGAKIGVGH